MITEVEFEKAASIIGCEVAALKAVQEIETSGKGGFLQNGLPAILFEGHIFWSELKKRGVNPESVKSGNEDIVYKIWTRKFYKGGSLEWGRLERAMKINEEAALASASWGMFQVMGYCYEECGCKSVAEFVAKMKESESAQLEITARFIRRNKRMLEPLIKKDWATFAKYYNGPQYKVNRYDTRLAAAYLKYKK